jgi:adenine phosphoribosyltransferase
VSFFVEPMEMLSNQTDLEFIADTIPYFPFHGVDRFYDISGLVANPAAFQVQTLSLLPQYLTDVVLL